MKIEGGSCIYALRNPLTQLIKVGMSDNVEKRKRDLESAGGVKLELLYSTDYLLCAKVYETDIHVKLNEFRELGEWFKVSPEMVVSTIQLSVESATQDPIVENYKKGMSISQLAKHMGVTRQAILARLKTYGIYSKDGKIYERHVSPVVGQHSIFTPRTDPGEAWDIKQINKDDEAPLLLKEREMALVKSYIDNIYFLDDTVPKLPLTNFKRSGPNLEFNGDWYKASVFSEGTFVVAYSQEFTRALSFIDKIKNGCKIENLQPR